VTEIEKCSWWIFWIPRLACITGSEQPWKVSSSFRNVFHMVY